MSFRDLSPVQATQEPSPRSPWAPIASISLLLQWHTACILFLSPVGLICQRIITPSPTVSPLHLLPLVHARPPPSFLVAEGEEYNPFRSAASVCTHIWLVRLHLVPVERGLSARLHPGSSPSGGDGRVAGDAHCGQC